MVPHTERIRDPIHDLIIFDENDPLDQIAWQLLETPEFQRLRRIKQLGLSDFVFPGATHTRFAHSVGVFHIARQLLRLIKREIELGRAPGQFNEHRAKVAVLAALLHDVGHGPFSHAFEESRKSISKKRGVNFRDHENWTAEIIRNPNGKILQILGKNLADEIAELIQAEIPHDMYHAIVSSSFDADRLDYLQRDRFMTGTASAAIDLTWLLDNVRVADIDVSPGGDGADPIYTHSFCLRYRAREAAEDFLLARYRLYSTVYFHRVTRGMEQLLAAVFRAIADATESGDSKAFGLGEDHPLVQILLREGGSLDAYLDLDDGIVADVIDRLSKRVDQAMTPDERLTAGLEERMAEISRRIRHRERPRSLDVQSAFPNDSERQRRARHRLDDDFQDAMGATVFRDEANLTLYGEIGADDTKAQKRLMIQLPNGKETREITNFGDAMVTGSGTRRQFLRYYFLCDSDYERAKVAFDEI